MNEKAPEAASVGVSSAWRKSCVAFDTQVASGAPAKAAASAPTSWKRSVTGWAASAFTATTLKASSEGETKEAKTAAADAPLALPSRKRQPGRTACVMCACVQKAAPST